MGNRILTNRFGLPETLVKAVELDTHVNKGTLSVTTLIDGAQIRKLKEQNNYEVDVSESIYALLGTSLHHILERANIDSLKKRAFISTAETLMQEAKKLEGSDTQQAHNLREVGNYLFKIIPVLFPEIGNRYIFEITLTMDYGDHVISGTFDLLDTLTGILYDYKFCSVYQYINRESRAKWDQQTNIYAFMLVNHGYTVTGIRIVAFFRDWNEFGTMKDRTYPERQIMEINVELRSMEKISGLIDKHLALHRQADEGNVPLCSAETRWATATEYAVMVPKGKRALSLQTSEPLAQKYIDENRHKKPNMYIDIRPGSSRRCEKYCVVSKHCPQYKKELEEAEKSKPKLNQQEL